MREADRQETCLQVRTPALLDPVEEALNWIVAPVGKLESRIYRRYGEIEANDPERTLSSESARCRRSVQRVPSSLPMQGTSMTDREKILIALREKPLKAFEIMRRVNIKHQDDCQSLLLKMRDDGAVKFDIHKGHWLVA
jgi:hypothetical protein